MPNMLTGVGGLVNTFTPLSVASVAAGIFWDATAPGILGKTDVANPALAVNQGDPVGLWVQPNDTFANFQNVGNLNGLYQDTISSPDRRLTVDIVNGFRRAKGNGSNQWLNIADTLTLLGGTNWTMYAVVLYPSATYNLPVLGSQSDFGYFGYYQGSGYIQDAANNKVVIGGVPTGVSMIRARKVGTSAYLAVTGISEPAPSVASHSYSMSLVNSAPGSGVTSGTGSISGLIIANAVVSNQDDASIQAWCLQNWGANLTSVRNFAADPVAPYGQYWLPRWN